MMIIDNNVVEYENFISHGKIKLSDEIRKVVSKLEEDRRLDLDIQVVNKLLVDGKFV